MLFSGFLTLGLGFGQYLYYGNSSVGLVVVIVFQILVRLFGRLVFEMSWHLPPCETVGHSREAGLLDLML